MWVKVGRGTPPFTVQSSFEGWKLGSSAFVFFGEGNLWQPKMATSNVVLQRLGESYLMGCFHNPSWEPETFRVWFEELAKTCSFYADLPWTNRFLLLEVIAEGKTTDRLWRELDARGGLEGVGICWWAGDLDSQGVSVEEPPKVA